MYYTDNIYLKFGADTKLEGLEYQDEIKEIEQQLAEFYGKS